MPNILDLEYKQESMSAMHREPTIAWATQPPVTGQWLAGDIIYNLAPTSGGASGWLCTASGLPGTWTTLPETVA